MFKRNDLNQKKDQNQSVTPFSRYSFFTSGSSQSASTSSSKNTKSASSSSDTKKEAKNPASVRLSTEDRAFMAKMEEALKQGKQWRADDGEKYLRLLALHGEQPSNVKGMSKS